MKFPIGTAVLFPLRDDRPTYIVGQVLFYDEFDCAMVGPPANPTHPFWATSPANGLVQPKGYYKVWRWSTELRSYNPRAEPPLEH